MIRRYFNSCRLVSEPDMPTACWTSPARWWEGRPVACLARIIRKISNVSSSSDKAPEFVLTWWVMVSRKRSLHGSVDWNWFSIVSQKNTLYFSCFIFTSFVPLIVPAASGILAQRVSIMRVARMRSLIHYHSLQSSTIILFHLPEVRFASSF